MKHGNEDLPSAKLDLRDTSIKNVLRQRRRFLLGHLGLPRMPFSVLLILAITIALIPVNIVDWAKRKNRSNPLMGTFLLFLMAPALVVIINVYFYRTYDVVGHSMEPTLQDSDKLIIDKTARTWSKITGHQYIPHRGDIVIVKQLATFDFTGPSEEELIKRVVGLPGERVVVVNDRITIYNSKFPSGFNPDDSGKYKINPDLTARNIDITLASNQIFVCGDNRGNSLDSRATEIGPINVDHIIGKLDVRFYPLNKTKSF